MRKIDKIAVVCRTVFRMVFLKVLLSVKNERLSCKGEAFRDKDVL